jgi:hypothetical protein
MAATRMAGSAATSLDHRHPGNRVLRKGRVSLPGRVYLVTTVTRGREHVFADFAAGCAAARCFEDARVLGDACMMAWVLMPDHGGRQPSACRTGKPDCRLPVLGRGVGVRVARMARSYNGTCGSGPWPRRMCGPGRAHGALLQRNLQERPMAATDVRAGSRAWRAPTTEFAGAAHGRDGCAGRIARMARSYNGTCRSGPWPRPTAIPVGRDPDRSR